MSMAESDESGVKGTHSFMSSDSVGPCKAKKTTEEVPYGSKGESLEIYDDTRLDIDPTETTCKETEAEADSDLESDHIACVIQAHDFEMLPIKNNNPSMDRQGDLKRIRPENKVIPVHSTDDSESVSDSDSDLSSESSSVSSDGSFMSADSADQFVDVVRTLRHYRRRQRSPTSHSSCSDCSCTSCESKSNGDFFGKQLGPPTGENSGFRRFTVWLESIKYIWGLLLCGTSVMLMVLLVLGFVTYKNGDDHRQNMGWTIILWTATTLGVTVVLIVAWRLTWFILLKWGYADGLQQVVTRKTLIKDAQKKNLVYTIRGAIYAPTRLNPHEPKKPAVYEVVAYENEYDSASYFNSDLEEDGQYRHSLTPWQVISDPVLKDRRNIYTRKAWFRDVPIIWNELSKQPLMDA